MRITELRGNHLSMFFAPSQFVQRFELMGQKDKGALRYENQQDFHPALQATPSIPQAGQRLQVGSRGSEPYSERDEFQAGKDERASGRLSTSRPSGNWLSGGFGFLVGPNLNEMKTRELSVIPGGLVP